MYEITRKKRLTEQLVLKNEDVQAVVDVDLDLLGDAKEFRAKYVGLVNAQKALQDAKSASGSHNLEEAHKQIGRSICELFRVIFGENGTDSILAFFDGNWTEAIEQVAPFIMNVVYPAFNQAAAERTPQLKKYYQARRKNRKWMQ